MLRAARLLCTCARLGHAFDVIESLDAHETLGVSVATMDLLIATAAIIVDAPLVMRNIKAFRHIPGLRVVTY